MIELVEDEPKGGSPDWHRICKAISSCKSTEFHALVNEAYTRKIEGDWKTFHRIVQGILGVRKSSNSIREIEDPLEPGQVIHEPEKLRDVLSAKYRELFMSDSDNGPFSVGTIEPTSFQEVSFSTELVSVNKGLGIDCIPDTILQDVRPEIKMKIVEFINIMFRRRSFIPTPFSCARLHLLNKLKSGTPGLEDLRPIMITSPIVKVIEAIALQELQRKLEPLIAPAQTGFVSGFGTQVHILRLVGKMKDIQENPHFKSGNWFVFFIDFKSAFDRVDHSLLFKKLETSGISMRTINILKLLYNSYHFSLLGDIPRRIKSGVAQGSLVSPLLYDWYVNDLVATLSQKFGAEYTFAYADDIALICLGYSEIRTAVSIIEDWSTRNGALLNKKKCGILSIRRKEVVASRKELQGIPFVQTYKYLGVPLDSALTLKYLALYLEEKLKKFTRRIGLMLHSVVGTRTRYNLWQNYARCHFDYFSPAIALCDQFSKFERLFTKSLKRALDLPLHLPNDPLLKVVGAPSLRQVAGHHVFNTTILIRERYSRCPTSLNDLVASLSHAADEYQALKKFTPLKTLPDGSLILDLLVSQRSFTRDVLGLATGVFLTLRCTHVSEGVIGAVRKCVTCCSTPATQSHFLNDCPINQNTRDLLLRNMPQGITGPLISSGDFFTFFANIRHLPAEVHNWDAVEEGLETLENLAATAATEFVSRTLQINAPKPAGCTNGSAC